MGGALHRLQVLIIGLTLLLAGAVVVALVFLRPPTQPTYLAITPAPVSAASPQVVALPTVAPTSGPVPARPQSVMPTVVLPAETIAALRGWWPLVLVTLGAVGLLVLGGRATRRRMAYTGQSVGMLLAAADARTRAANRRVMRALHAQGQLPVELAVAAGISPRLRWPTLPRLSGRLPQLRVQLPTVSFPIVTWPRLAIPRLRLPPVRLMRRRVAGGAPALDFVPLPALPTDAQGRSILAEPLALDPEALAECLPDEGAETETLPAEGASPARSSAEDRALAVAGALDALWHAREFTSKVLALDTTSRAGAGPVTVTIEVAPEDDEALLTVPELLAATHDGWQARWAHQNGTPRLIVEGIPGASAPEAVPLLAPLLAHGRSQRTLRFWPFATWRHLGIYGDAAQGALHALLASLLYAQSPRDLALAILDQGQVSSLYAGVAHHIAPPGDACDTLHTIAHTLRRPPLSQCRALLLVVIEPDAPALAALGLVLARLQQRPDAPLHVLLVQERLLAPGREVYARLPALITGRGQGSAAWLPGQSEWPQHGVARLVGRGMRSDGRALQLTEAETVAALAPLRRAIPGLPLVLWDDWPTASVDLGVAAVPDLASVAPVPVDAGELASAQK